MQVLCCQFEKHGKSSTSHLTLTLHHGSQLPFLLIFHLKWVSLCHERPHPALSEALLIVIQRAACSSQWKQVNSCTEVNLLTKKIWFCFLFFCMMIMNVQQRQYWEKEMLRFYVSGLDWKLSALYQVIKLGIYTTPDEQQHMTYYIISLI